MRIHPDVVLYGLALYIAVSMVFGGCQVGVSPALSQDVVPDGEGRELLVLTSPVDEACCEEIDRDREERRAQLRLADAVSRVCAHESSFVSAADCLLVWQATRRHGETAEQRLAWLYIHSPCALRGSRCGTGRHQGDPGHWSAFLPVGSSMEAPQGFPESLSWDDYAPRWARMRSMVRHLISGDTPPGGWPCREDPDSWAGRIHDADHILENAEHLRALDCRDPATGEPTRNEGFRWR